MLDEIMRLAWEVRGEFYNDILEFLGNGVSEHDCYEISTRLADRIAGELGIEAGVVSVRWLIDAKHFAVLVVVGGEEYVVDAAPELSGLFDRIVGPLVLAPEDYRRFVLENSYVYGARQ